MKCFYSPNHHYQVQHWMELFGTSAVEKIVKKININSARCYPFLSLVNEMIRCCTIFVVRNTCTLLYGIYCIITVCTVFVT